MTNALNQRMNKLNGYLNILVAFFVVAIIGMIVIPLPAFLLDILLVMNIAISVTILVLTLFTHSVLEFSSFPTMLLVTTMIRLALNISSTRLILSEGYAGEVIDTFATFVTGNNYIVGAVIFLIITIIQMVVITSGSSRVSEVSARFTLDAMPGKQMAIDADLNAGLITEDVAKKRRNDLQLEANFYGAMDGASKFVKGDAIAGIIITIINLIGGILIHSMQGNYTVMEAIAHFGQLTIGDGLVSQVPSLMISVASGILVTRTANAKGFGETLGGELFGTPQVLFIVAAVMGVFTVVPGFPTVPFLLIGLIMGVAAYLLMQNEKEAAEETAKKEARAAAEMVKKEPVEEPVSAFQVDPIAIEIGYGLIPLADESKDSNLTSHIATVRRQCSQEMGIVLSPIRIRDNLQLSPNAYSIKIKGNEIANGELYVDKFMVVEPGGEFEIQGIPAKEPAFGLDALWIVDSEREKAELYGYTVVDPLTVLVTHLKEMIRKNAYELLGRQEVKQLLEGIKDQYNVVIDELIPDVLCLGEVQKVLQNLLREDVPINDLVTILETLADYGNSTKDTETLTEYVRQALKRTVVKPHLDENNTLTVMTVHPDTEEHISQSIQKSSAGSIPVLQPQVITSIFDSINQQHNQLLAHGLPHVLLTSPKIRPAMKNLISFNFPDLAVLSLNEVPNEVSLETGGMIEIGNQ
ncbi:flagellar biosynthesis protein FlhA [Atopococcus tabaci]|uniref:flagellar biosynthesis protein FlhA n=1 Tax=Atopococcus tabaci TaxID=269774 RepID=UPI00042A30D4|nr:flagellar biosynthesis protein FlhA [Atopococcus tabaci]